ncbi:PEP-CTERM sorting domain-containing protein [Aquariibacter albus]|uniref:PEP-CTERM sorting domain-containing protein n=1 Tax=Aquariibacter albus TaxID=2759899 RepID=A0A839HNC9_9BURK|nr:PEP-CTERM sorting domain-containing protein [Aquariibacter albus]MBB1162962.1 PEP-CTERM sorting domain-containing protein [Aquariibacter albus]
MTAIRRSSLLTVLPLLAALAVPAARAETITFNDLQANIQVPTPYQGFQWGASWYAIKTADKPSVYTSASGTSLFARRFDGKAFYFDGADYWSRRGVDAAGFFWFVLYYKGQTVYSGVNSSKDRMRFTATPTLFKPPYTGPVDMVAIAFGSNGKDWNHLAMDNFRFRPAP